MSPGAARSLLRLNCFHLFWVSFPSFSLLETPALATGRRPSRERVPPDLGRHRKKCGVASSERSGGSGSRDKNAAVLLFPGC